MQVTVLYQDEDLVVVDKPAGMPTHAADAGDVYPADALRVVSAQLGLSYLGMHQRLDADTSGVLLFAARREANPALAAQFSGEAQRPRKVYLAIVNGTPRQKAGSIDAPLVREHGGRYRVTSSGDRLGQSALTRYRLLASAPGDRYSLLEVVPETGRTHQIRVHLAHIGTPVAGDTLYQPAERSLARLCLHAYQLTLAHPDSGQPITFTAPPPPIFDHLPAGLPELDLAHDLEHIRSGTRTRDLPALRALLSQALERRQPLAADPSTNIYRLVNGRADGLPGLTVDRYGDVLVASLYDEPLKMPPQRVPGFLVDMLAELSGARSIYVKYRPVQASRVGNDEMAQLAPASAVHGPDAQEIAAQEEGLTYLIRPGDGLSTGLFADMRESRYRVRKLATGQRVLNCFAYTCGFGVAATIGGASRVLNLDLSRSALERGQANYRANGLSADAYDFVYGDVFDWLARLARRHEQFDMVILDPPGTSKTRDGRFAAERDYGKLAVLAAGVVASEGLLLCCANVAGLPWRAFRDRVLEALTAAGRSATVLGVYHEPAIDFPRPPGRAPYLKMLLLRLA